MRLRLVPLALLALAVPATAHAGKPDFKTVKVAGSIGTNGTEPRIAVGSDNTRYISTNEGENDTEGWPFVVYKSTDGGRSWQKTASDPAQTAASIDTDMVTLPTGRILASELDYGGLTSPPSSPDEGGKRGPRSRGPPHPPAQARQWFAVGPVPKGSPAGTQPPVYFLYHNFASGIP